MFHNTGLTQRYACSVTSTVYGNTYNYNNYYWIRKREICDCTELWALFVVNFPLMCHCLLIPQYKIPNVQFSCLACQICEI